MYAIVDIETTGGSATKSRITEIAIYKFDGEKVVDQYETLINPKRNIPPNISRLTGITDDLVADAPIFSAVLEQIDAITKDCIFVAHNVNFDYNFIRAEYNRLGKIFQRKKLCTVRLSRKILRGHPSYSLGKLCQAEGIEINNRHRAAGDAEATTVLFKKLLAADVHDIIKNALKPQSLEALLPPQLVKSDFMALPETQGLYYFINAQKQIIYIGKAKNIKKRVHSHFSGNTNTASKSYFLDSIYQLDFKIIESKLLLDIVEATEIKKHWPAHNRSMKRFSLNYGIFQYQDRKGYERLTIGRSGKNTHPIATYQKKEQAIKVLQEMLLNYELCPRLLGLQPMSSGNCSYVIETECKGACCGKETAESYNQRFHQAIATNINSENSFFICEEAQTGKAVVFVEKGRYKGYGILPTQSDLTAIDEIKSKLITAYDDQDLNYLIHRYAKENKEKVIYL